MTASSTAMHLAAFVLLAGAAMTAQSATTPAVSIPEKKSIGTPAEVELSVMPETVLAAHQLRVEQISAPMHRLLRREARRLVDDPALDVSHVRESLAFVFDSEDEAIDDTGGLGMDELVQMVLVEALMMTGDDAKMLVVVQEPAERKLSPEATRDRYRVLFAALAEPMVPGAATTAADQLK